jgi:hypothetical protein
MRTLLLVLPLAALPLGGCIAKTAVDVVTLPVRAGAQVVDWTTTSQDEADRNYGRRMRKAEAREGKERRAWQKRCRRDPEGCGDYDGYRASHDAKVR